MIVEQVWTGNAYRNFNYLIVCPESGEALAIDPLDHPKALSLYQRFGFVPYRQEIEELDTRV